MDVLPVVREAVLEPFQQEACPTEPQGFEAGEGADRFEGRRDIA